MGRFIVQFFAFIGFLVVLAIVLGVVLALNSRGSRPRTPDVAVLKLDLTRDYPDVADQNPLSQIGGASPVGFLDVLTAIDRAANDGRIKGLIADLSGTSLSYARAQELRDTLARFRAQGKFAYAYARDLPGSRDYYMASGFDQIAVQPMGGVGLTGLATERLFLRGTLDKIGVDAQVERRSEYKTVFNNLLFNGYSPPEREMLQSFLGSISTQMIEGVAKGRNLSADDVRADIDRGPLTTEEALKAHLIDRIAYPDEVRDSALAKASEGANGKAKLFGVEKYVTAIAGEAVESGTRIALVPASGLIVDENSGDDALTGRQLGGRELAHGIDAAVQNKEVRAILLRVDSPGGSVTGSDTIRHALLKAKQAGKPVVVSMGGVAGSGGYWISMAADSIIAEPATITGSIGVISLKPDFEKLASDLGANFDRITFGANAAINSVGKPYSDSEHERVAAQIDAVYNAFKQGVAEGRNMTVEAVEKIAKGRVWSGTQGKDIGLIDQLGGFDTAKAVLRQKLNLPSDARLTFEVYPKPVSFAEMLRRAFGGGTPDDNEVAARDSLTTFLRSDAAVPKSVGPLLERLRPYLRVLALGATGEPVALAPMPVNF